jgi:ABC-type lipoprotein release transport system permease subunit
MKKTKNEKWITLKAAFFIAWKNISKNKGRVMLTVFMISLGFISSIIVYGMLKDTSSKLQQDFIDTTFGDVILQPLDHQLKIDNVSEILDKVNALPYVEGAAAINTVSARLYDSQGNYLDTQILIVDPNDFAKASLIGNMLNDGRYLTENEPSGIFMGCLNLNSCSSFTNSIPNIYGYVGKNISADFTNGISANLTLVGNYVHSLAAVEGTNLISEQTAENIFPGYNSNQADEIIIRLQDKSMAQTVVDELSYLGVNAVISDWNEKLAFYSQTVDSFGIIGNLSFLIGVIVSIIGVYIVVYINALNKKVQIGIMRAIGIRSRIISLSYIIQGFVYGVLGSILGGALLLLMIGYFTVSPILNPIGQLVPEASFGIFMLVAVTIIIASTLTGYFASRRIIRKKILDLISNE